MDRLTGTNPASQTSVLMDRLTGTNPEVIVGNYWAHKIKFTEPLGTEGMFIPS